MLGRPKLVLASGSPRRLSLLNQAGIEPDALRPTDVDETPKSGEHPRVCASRLARVKAERNARTDAASKIRRGLTALGWHGDDAAFETLITSATSTPDYGGDGSVTLVLSVSTEGLVLRSSK